LAVLELEQEREREWEREWGLELGQVPELEQGVGLAPELVCYRLAQC
jgi:hypothetical protein